MMKKIILLLFVLVSWQLHAQKIPLINYEETPLQYNPSSISYDIRAKLNFYNRIQKIQSGPEFSTSVFTGVLPFVTDKKRGHLAAIGVSFLSDDLASGDLLREENFTLALAYKLKIAERLHLGMGVSWNVLQRFFDGNGFTTGSQYVIGSGFNPDLAINEDLKDISGGYSAWNTGLLLEKRYSSNIPHYFIGISVSNLNRPVYTSGTENKERLSYQYGVQGGYNFLFGETLYLIADGDLRFQKEDEWLNLGLNMRYAWKNPNGGFFREGCVSLVPRYVVDKAYALALEFSQSFYSIRIGRSVNSSKINSSYMSSNEILVTVRKNFGARKKEDLTSQIKKTRSLLRKKREEFLWDDVYWDYKDIDKHDIIDKGLKKFMDSLVEYMEKHKNSIVHIYVYTDMMADDAKNLEVSVHRAETLSNYFEEHGIARNRIDYFGKGNSKPIVQHAYGQDKLKNRRIEFVIYR